MTEDAGKLDEIWAGDHLSRRDEAEHLSAYLTRRYRAKKTEKGFVLAINADWGAGKTFLMDRWRQQLAFQNHPVAYFDAWSNDYTPEPLVAFIAELNKALEDRFKSMPVATQLQLEWVKKAKAVIAPTLKATGYAVGKHILGLGAKELTELYQSVSGAEPHENKEGEADKFDVKGLGEQVSKAAEAALKDHATTKKAIAAFKEKLGALIAHLAGESGVELPIFVLIDELDRCRPDYAIKLLEGIKHLFGVPGVYFVIATNIPQLAHSINAVYGVGFDSERYLKRFFDLEYELEIPNDLGFARELMSRIVHPEPSQLITGYEMVMSNLSASDHLAFTFERYAAAFDLQPRDQEQVARVLEAAFLALEGTRIHIHFLLFLAIVNQRRPKILSTIIRTNNVATTPGFEDIFSSREAVSFHVMANENGRRVKKTVGADEVATLYFRARAANTRPTEHTFEFPGNLVVEIYEAEKSGQLKQYIEIVLRAGRFKK